jgi:hypothetical protein
VSGSGIKGFWSCGSAILNEAKASAAGLFRDEVPGTKQSWKPNKEIKMEGEKLHLTVKTN